MKLLPHISEAGVGNTTGPAAVKHRPKLVLAYLPVVSRSSAASKLSSHTVFHLRSVSTNAGPQIYQPITMNIDSTAPTEEVKRSADRQYCFQLIDACVFPCLTIFWTCLGPVRREHGSLILAHSLCKLLLQSFFCQREASLYKMARSSSLVIALASIVSATTEFCLL